MTKQLAWGILGTGWIAGLQTSDLIEHGHNVVAVGSRTAKAAAKFAAEYGIPLTPSMLRLPTPSTKSTLCSRSTPASMFS